MIPTELQDVRCIEGDRLTDFELDAGRKLLLHLSQHLSNLQELERLQKGQLVATASSLLTLSPLLGDDGLIMVGRKLESLWYHSTHPIISDQKSRVTKLLMNQVHVLSKHAGPNVMMSILAENYHIVGVKVLVWDISRAYAKTAAQFMGQLPPEHLKPAPPFTITGIDFAGPVIYRCGSPRKSVDTKAYICIFICFTMKAILLELVSDLSTDAFMATFVWFAGRCGCPIHVFSDNMTNFVGADRELREIQELL